jgi:hydroxyacylglutathione hydrolase
LDTDAGGPAPHYSGPDLTLYKFPSGPYNNNAYLLVCPQTSQSIVIDTPGSADELIEAAKRTRVQAVLITHGHFDHLMGYEEIVPELGANAGIGAGDAGDVPSPAQIIVQDGDSFTAGTIKLTAIATPGHTPGSTCYVVGRHLFTGDTLFPGGPGKSGSPEAFRQLVDSIKTRLFVLDPASTFYPGHGADGLLQDAMNEYGRFAEKSHPGDLHGDVTWLGS